MKDKVFKIKFRENEKKLVDIQIWTKTNNIYSCENRFYNNLNEAYEYINNNFVLNYTLVSKEKIDTLLDKYNHNNKYNFTAEDKCNFIAYDNDCNKWIAVDNTNGDMFLEEFNMFENAEFYIENDYESNEIEFFEADMQKKIYIPEEKEIEQNVNLEKQKSYLTFVLGYDLLNDMLSKSFLSENDVSYDFCNYITEKFLESEEYKNEKRSSYDILHDWVEKNKEDIKNEYNLFFMPEEKKMNTLEFNLKETNFYKYFREQLDMIIASYDNPAEYGLDRLIEENLDEIVAILLDDDKFNESINRDLQQTLEVYINNLSNEETTKENEEEPEM